jgi:hypothetical protein
MKATAWTVYPGRNKGFTTYCGRGSDGRHENKQLLERFHWNASSPQWTKTIWGFWITGMPLDGSAHG